MHADAKVIHRLHCACTLIFLVFCPNRDSRSQAGQIEVVLDERVCYRGLLIARKPVPFLLLRDLECPVSVLVFPSWRFLYLVFGRSVVNDTLHFEHLWSFASIVDWVQADSACGQAYERLAEVRPCTVLRIRMGANIAIEA